jgi:hypothetical protein
LIPTCENTLRPASRNKAKKVTTFFMTADLAVNNLTD